MSEKDQRRRKRPTPDPNGARGITLLGPRWTCHRCGQRIRTTTGLPVKTTLAVGGFVVYCGDCSAAMRSSGTQQGRAA